jgi:hypothetical protein
MDITNEAPTDQPNTKVTSDPVASRAAYLLQFPKQATEQDVLMHAGSCVAQSQKGKNKRRKK